MGKAKVFPYNQRRGRQFYEQKRVEVIVKFARNDGYRKL
jgi:hypothetical protein